MNNHRLHRMVVVAGGRAVGVGEAVAPIDGSPAVIVLPPGIRDTV